MFMYRHLPTLFVTLIISLSLFVLYNPCTWFCFSQKLNTLTIAKNVSFSSIAYLFLLNEGYINVILFIHPEILIFIVSSRRHVKSQFALLTFSAK